MSDICMFCDEPGEWTYHLAGMVCQGHWENPHDAVSLRAELEALRARLDEAARLIEEARQMSSWYATVCNSYETHPHFDELEVDKNAYFYLRSEGDLIGQAAAAWLAAAPQEEKVCEWKHEDSEWQPENWETGCLSTFAIDRAKPGMLFCPYCGGKIVVNREEEAR